MRTVQLFLDEPHQKYRNKYGDILPSVTSIIGKHIAIPQLVPWAFGLGKRGKCLEKDGGKKRRIGSIFHFGAHGFLDGFKCDFSLCAKDEVECAEEMMEGFKKWWWKSGLDRIHCELQLASDKHGFGGTVDLIARDKQGRLVLVDFKTSSSLKPQYELQMAGYKMLYEDCHPFDEDIEAVKLLRIGYENDIEERNFEDLTPQMEAWKAILRFHSAYKQIEDRTKGQKTWPRKRKSKASS